MTGRKIVYCYTPARWLYQTDRYLGRPDQTGGAGHAVKRRVLESLRPRLERWDRAAAASAHRYLVVSSAVAGAVRDLYGIEPTILPPPPAIDGVGPQQPVAGLEPGFWLCVSRLLPYKNVDAIVEAARGRADTRLVVVGDGPERSRLDALGGRGVTFLGKVPDAQLRWCYANRRALIAASYEDFGLTPLEAAALGRPSVALRAGGFLDTIVEGQTGVLFDAPDSKHLSAAMDELDSQNWPAEYSSLRRSFSPRSTSPTAFAKSWQRKPPPADPYRRPPEKVRRRRGPEYSSRSHPENAQIPPDGPRGDVEVVQSLELVEAQLASAGDLPQPGHARPDLESTLRGPVDRVRFGRDERPRADERHVAAQHIEKLWHLVEARLAQEATDLGHAGVDLHLEKRSVHFVRVVKRVTRRLRHCGSSSAA